jgi:hypothetical protein
MSETAKSGQQVIDEFFAEIEGMEGVAPDVAQVIRRLHADGKLTNTNLANELGGLREAGLCDQNPEH